MIGLDDNMDVESFVEGQLLLIDKPLQWTSFQAVNKLRWLITKKFGLKKIKVGHAGTLDPLATGLLLVCTGKMTKKIDEFQGMYKEYTGKFTLGATTPSFDLETAIDTHYPTAHITEILLQATAKTFIGKIEQVPPIYSAVKKDGERLYEIARKGLTTKISARKIEIHEFELTKIQLPEVSFRVRCSKGTYIRSLAHDFGQALQSGAYLSALRRTKIGDFDVNLAISPQQFEEKISSSLKKVDLTIK